MVLFFCVDEANRIWLTHCATLKTERLREHIMVTTGRFGAAPHLLGGPPRLLMRHGLSPPLLPSTAAAALRLRSPDGSRGISGGGASGGGALSGEASLDLPAPSAAFVASKSAAATDASSEAAAAAGRFLCVLTGEMYPGTQRCDVTYKQLLQHWFGLASQLPNEGDRLRAMDTIPLAIRRANPSLTREWYLRVRSQPTFLYRTAPVCLEAATQITGMALDELQRTLMPSPSAMGAVAAAAAAAVGAAAAGPAGPQHHGGASVSNPGNGLLVGWAASATQNHGSPPTTARGAMPEVLSRQNTTSTTRVQLVAVPSVRQRPATALPPAGPSGHLLPLQQPTSFRSGSRLAQQQQQAQPGAGPPRRFPMTRSKSASPSVAASRLALAPTSSGGGGGGGSGGLPSMLREKGGTAGAGLGKQHSFLQAYGPTPEQAAEAAAIAAVLPYEVLDEARQLAATEPSEAAAGAVAAAATEASSPRSNHHSHHSANRDGHGGDEDGDNIGCGGGSCRDDDGDSDGSEIDETRPNGALAGQHVVSAPNSKMAHVSGGGGSGPGSPGRRAGPGLGYATAAATAAHAGGGNSGGNYIAPRPIRVLPGRVSTSSEITEMGSVASFSDPSSPNGPHTAYHQQQSNSNPHAHAYTHGYTPTHGHTPPLAGGGGGGGGGGAGGPASSIPPSRMSPPRSAGAPTLHTIHEEGAIAAPPPPASPSKRACSPLGGPELHFPPPPRGGAGSHSVPRMRPNTRSGLDRQLVPGHGVSVGAAGRRHPGPTQMYSHSSGGASAAAAAAGSGGSHGGLQRRNSFSESGDLPALPGAAAAAAAASLNSTMASSIGSLSRRSTSNQAVLSNEDMRTLRELNEAYSAAERLTQQLLAQAHEILSEDGSSRPGSTGNSPMHGGRRPPPSPRGPTPTSRPGTGNSGLTTGVTRQASSSGSGTGGLIRVSSGSGRPGTGGTQRPSSSSLLPAPSPVPAAPSTSGSGLGPSPLGQREPYVGRSGSGRGLGHGVAGGGGGAAAATDKGLASAAAPGALPPVQNSIGSQPTAAQGAVGVGPEEASGSSGSGASLAVTGSQPYPAPRNLDLLTSAEADLLAEALQA
ncbi:hypothetical protein Vafri_11795 [Volvox africanus]|uniref:Uncharacterized protein n=1 Tax=Volvox africanus TaxID=51714 RepID=A0A8J4F220_9CHLO|nr:hypothetical protein Vafri_11795 [Volvox africanus]